MSESNSNKDKKPAEFLTDREDLDEAESYISPNIEAKLAPKKRLECREIVQEIHKFGVSQRQMLYLIYLLSLELENREVMLALTDAVGANRDKIAISSLVIPGQESD
jgi:hypothetical protein